MQCDSEWVERTAVDDRIARVITQKSYKCVHIVGVGHSCFLSQILMSSTQFELILHRQFWLTLFSAVLMLRIIRMRMTLLYRKITLAENGYVQK
jgi:hypothetical protein